MTDSNKPIEDMVRNWTDMQQRMWDTWLQTLRGMQAPTGMPGAEEWQKQYQKNLEAWEQAVREALDAQVRWSQQWAEKAGGGQMPNEQMQEVAKQTQEMMKAWTEAQSKLWNAWFDSVKNMDPSHMGDIDAEGQNVLKAWQDATRRAQEAMQELSRVATSGAAGTGSTAGSGKASSGGGSGGSTGGGSGGGSGGSKKS